MLKLINLLAILCVLSHCDAQMGLIGIAVEAFNTCDDLLGMDRQVGGRPSEENYWNGTFRLEKWPNLSEVRISITLDNPASVVVDKEQARVLVYGNTFHLSYFDAPPKLMNAEFVVRGPARGAFPNVEKITLNGEVVCDHPEKFVPNILGETNNAQSLSNDPVKSPCGQRLVQHQGLITNGFPTQEGDWPWHAALRHINPSSNVYSCGGTLINKNTVMTAAHCVHNNEKVIVAERLLVQVGKHNREIASSYTQDYAVYRVVPHPQYDSNALANDIALLRLQNDVTFSDYIQPACLWHQDRVNLNEVVGRNGTVIGWGLDSNRKLTDILSQGTMPIISVSACLTSARNFYGLFLTDTNFCAGYRNGTSVCKGDSGGGLFLKENDNLYYIRGLVSLAKAKGTDCDLESYVIFTDVAKFLDWIKENLSE